MASLLRQALEGQLIAPVAAPDDDPMMRIFQAHFPGHFEAQAYVLEERSDGKAEKEIEYTIYARLVDPTQLGRAKSMEHQEQWEVRIPKTEENAGKGSFRVRKTTIDGAEPQYTRVTKIAYNKDNDKIEIPLPSNHDEFTAFKFLANLGMVKDRFHFPVMGTELVWEVDCFPKEGGGYHEWVKIDLEVKDRDTPLPDFPIDLEDVILPPFFGKITEEEHDQRVSELYEQYFLKKNEFVSGEMKAKLQSQVPDKQIDLGDGDAQGPRPDTTPEGEQGEAAPGSTDEGATNPTPEDETA